MGDHFVNQGEYSKGSSSTRIKGGLEDVTLCLYTISGWSSISKGQEVSMGVESNPSSIHRFYRLELNSLSWENESISFYISLWEN